MLIGTHHGHSAKLKDLPLIMATDRPEDWGQTAHRYWYVGHAHHERVVETQGVKAESFNTMAAKDAWHANKGYRPSRAAHAIVMHREHGEVARHTVTPEMLD